MAGRCVNINRRKSKVILYNYRGIPAVVNSVRYLGTDLDNSRRCYNIYRVMNKDGTQNNL